jgi:hypothetical protein
MKHLLTAIILLLTTTAVYSTNAEKAFDAVARQEFQQLSQALHRSQPHVNKIRTLLRKPTSATPLQNFEGVEAIYYAINNQCCALTLALAYRGVPLFISDRNSKLVSPLCIALNKFSVPQFELLLQCVTNTQGYDIDQLDNYDHSLLEQIFRIPNFTPPIELIELLVVRFKAEVDMGSHCSAHAKLSSYEHKDHQRFFELMGHPYNPSDIQAPQLTANFQSASPEVIAEINRKLEAAYQEAERKRIPHAEELFTQIKLRLDRQNRKMGSPSITAAPAHALVKTARELAIAEKSGDPTAIKIALKANQNAVNSARIAIEEKTAARKRRAEIQQLKDSFETEKAAI